MATDATHVNGTTYSKQTRETVRNVRCGKLVNYTLTEHQFETMYNGRHGDIKLNIAIGCISALIGFWLDYFLIEDAKSDVYVAVFACLNVVLTTTAIICAVAHYKTRQDIDRLYTALRKEAMRETPNPAEQ